jgi:transcriptional regulator with XRE-family HTH domain
MEPKEYLKQVGQNITKIRKSKKLTLKELALESDMEKSNLIPIEKGRINVTVTTLVKLANALNVEVKEFFKF